MNNYHRNNRANSSNNSYGRSRYSGGRGRSRASRFKTKTISMDKLIAKAIDSEPVNIYVDDYEYSQFAITKTLKRNAYEKGYSKPTKIQYQAIPQILEGKDILGIANTGTGKTAAFLIPMINKAIKETGNKCLIIVPTRELAMQIQDEFRDLSRSTGLQSVLIIGGQNMHAQMKILRREPEFIICTPGRLKDLHQRRAINLSRINNIVLDEVDRMLDMGFIGDIKEIIGELRPNRQSLFFSATMNRKCEEIANKFLTNPMKIEIKSDEPSKNVDQDIVKLEKGENKRDVLFNLLKQKELEKVLVFTATKHEADNLCKKLRDRNIYVEALHGNKRQNQRTKIIDNFKSGHVNVLIATDVASRGLDVDNITHVINYDMPNNYEDYLHRIGRTGRAGKKGFALTFV